MKKQVFLISIVVLLACIVSCQIDNTGTGGAEEVAGGQEKVVVQLYLYQEGADSRAIDDTEIEHDVIDASISQTVLNFLDSTDNIIRSVIVDSAEFETRVEIEFTITELAAIAQLNVQNYWIVNFTPPETMITERTVDLVIQAGYNLIRINIGNFYGVGVEAQTTSGTLQRGQIQILEGGDIAFPDDSFDFGIVNQGDTADLVFTIENIGDADLNVSQIALTVGDVTSFSVNGGEGILSAGASTNFTATYAPQESGNHTAIVRIASDDLMNPNFEITVNGLSYQIETETLEYIIPDTYVWSAPENLISGTATITIVGAGGGGGGFSVDISSGHLYTGEGGRSGQIMEHTIPIEANQTFAIIIGSGGLAGSNYPEPYLSGTGEESSISTLGVQLISIGGDGGRTSIGTNYDPNGETNGTGYGTGGEGGTSDSIPTEGQDGLVRIVWSGYTE